MIATSGLRDRKREQTRLRIEDAALEVALEVGVDAATVDAISERAEISQRTFFNYFDTKDDAILGVHPVVVDKATLTEHQARYAHAELPESMIGLLFLAMGPSIKNPAVKHKRMLLIHQHPSLLGRHASRIVRISGELAVYARELIRRQDEEVSVGVPEILVMASLGAVRATLQEIANQQPPVEWDPHDVQHRAATLLREAMALL